MFGVSATANPQQPVERHARRRSRCWIKSIACIHQRAKFIILRHQRVQDRCTARRSRPENIGHTSPWNAAKRGVEARDSRWQKFRRRPLMQLKINGLEDSGVHDIRFLFASTLIMQKSASHVKGITFQKCYTYSVWLNQLKLVLPKKGRLSSRLPYAKNSASRRVRGFRFTRRAITSFSIRSVHNLSGIRSKNYMAP